MKIKLQRKNFNITNRKEKKNMLLKQKLEATEAKRACTKKYKI